MEQKFFNLRNGKSERRGRLTSFIYGNENNTNKFPPSSFVKSRTTIYNEIIGDRPIFDSTDCKDISEDSFFTKIEKCKS